MKGILLLALPVAWLSADNSSAGSRSTNLATPVSTWIVTNSVPMTNEITFDGFLKEVVAANLDYAAQRYNVSIAQAAIAAAKEFQNPTLELSGDRDLTFHGKTGTGSDGRPANLTQVESRGVGLTQPIEWPGKRRARILGARQNQAAAAATLESFLRNLKLDAAAAFAEALAQSRTAEQKRQTAEFLTNLVKAQHERLRVGDVGEVDVLRTQVEEQQFQNELLAAQADAENASLALSQFLGRDRGQTVLIPRGNLEIPPREFDLPKLLADALSHRADLIALRYTRDAGQSGIRLAKASRVPDVGVGVTYTHNDGVAINHPVDPTPSFDQLTLSFSLPLPLWNRNRAAIDTARFTASQAQKQLEAAELKAEVQIRQAFTTYRSSVERVSRYRGTILKDAGTVLESKRFSYQRGQATLLELLDAQRTANEVRASYNDALADHAKALIELQRTAELWEIEF